MKIILMFISLIVMPMSVNAVTLKEDVATTIMLRGYPCGGSSVTQVREKSDASGNRVITATCPNGLRYRINVSSNGRVTVRQID